MSAIMVCLVLGALMLLTLFSKNPKFNCVNTGINLTVGLLMLLSNSPFFVILGVAITLINIHDMYNYQKSWINFNSDIEKIIDKITDQVKDETEGKECQKETE